MSENTMTHHSEFKTHILNIHPSSQWDSCISLLLRKFGVLVVIVWNLFVSTRVVQSIAICVWELGKLDWRHQGHKLSKCSTQVSNQV